MALFIRNEKQQALHQDQGPRVDVYKSLGLQALFQLLHPEQKYRIMDLGPAIGANIEFLSQYASKIRVLDAYETLSDAGFFARGEGPCDEEAVGRMLSVPDREEFDIVFGWDLFNYLTLDELKPLIQYVKRRCVAGTLFFAMVSTQKEMPSLPTTFRIRDQESLLYCLGSAETRSCPRFAPRDMTILMSGFGVHSSYMLRNGMQEYVFVHR